MVEQPKWPGLWICPDYKTALNDKPPFRYRCNGMKLTDQGAAEFDGAMRNLARLKGEN